MNAQAPTSPKYGANAHFDLERARKAITYPCPRDYTYVHVLRQWLTAACVEIAQVREALASAEGANDPVDLSPGICANCSMPLADHDSMTLCCPRVSGHAEGHVEVGW